MEFRREVMKEMLGFRVVSHRKYLELSINVRTR
jgi:hypothetical protein